MDLAARQRAEELRSIHLHLQKDMRLQALKQLDERGGAQELVRQQYFGRYPFELLQNADDAARETGTQGRTRFILTATALLIADDGTGFGEQQVQAICSLGRSSKGPGSSIGHKGLGFKSVGEITDQPQIISASTQFQFNAARVHADLVDLFGELPTRQRFPTYAFPYPIDDDDLGDDIEEVRQLREDHFTTVIRLPLRDGLDRGLVAEHLIRNLQPRLLLFLPSTEHLALIGTDGDFSAEAARQSDEHVERVLLETKSGPDEDWLIYRGSTTPSVEALEPMGEAWARLDRVEYAVAVPLDASSEPQPRVDETFPLHVFFPTEERPGLHVAVHAEWALTMDRTRIARTREAIELNREITAAVIDFVQSTVAVDLVQRHGASTTSIQALIPDVVDHLDGTAQNINEDWHSALAGVPFLPRADGRLARPIDIDLLPASIPDVARAHELATLPADRTLRPDIEAEPAVWNFVSAVSEDAVMTYADYFSLLKTPTQADAHHYYSFLVAWHREDYYLKDELRPVPCVLTTNGQFLSPAESSIFFPRRDDSLPDDIPVPIALLPDVDGLEGLLRDLEVKNFDWRDLIRDYLIKILEDKDAKPDDRARAMNGLRSYQASRRAAGEAPLAILGRVLVPARNGAGTRTSLRPAGGMYFGREWTGSSDLEEIYGPFGKTEFLAIDVPEQSEARNDEHDFYRMLGVIDHPRLHRTSSIYAIGGSRHPHFDPLFNEWLNHVDARTCPQAHDQSQQLIDSYRLDRQHDLLGSKDPRRLLALWNQLARNWGKVYEDGLHSTVRCAHGWHRGDANRAVESLFAYALRSSAWVPVEHFGKAEFLCPQEAWVQTSSDVPARILERIPRISEAMHHTHGGPMLVEELGLIDMRRPRITDLLRLLESVATEADAEGTISRDVERSARWIQRSIEEMLSADSPPHPSPETIRVLATHAGRTRFVTQPPYAEDPLLRGTWQHEMPVLSADAGSNKFTDYLGLAKLDELVDTVPIALGVRDGDALLRASKRIDAAKPYIIALIRSENARAERRAMRALRRLEVVVCERLILQYTYAGTTLERDDAACYIATRIESSERRTDSVGTAHLEFNSTTGEPNWFAVGRQLAQYLGVPSHADAITMLLKVEATDRDRMMSDRHIEADLVAEARSSLNLPLEDDYVVSSVLDEYLVRNKTAIAQGANESELERPPESPDPQRVLESSIAGNDRPDPPAVVERPKPPPVDYDAVKIVDAEPAVVLEPQTSSGRSTTPGVSVSTAPPVQSDAEKRRIGKRGEEVAYAKERDRLVEMGMDPDAVIWQSKTDETAPFDIVSFDEEGQRIFIEVKSTVGSDPGEPFYISPAELVEAGSRGSNYYIYRVTDVDTAAPTITRWPNPIQLVRNGQGRLLLATAQMQLGLESPKT